MDLILNTGIDGIKLGLCYAIVAMGMYIAYSVLDFPDLTADGSFPLGGVVGTIILYRFSLNPIFALLGGFVCGAVAGMVTGILHVKFNISKLLSSIITMTALLSVTLALTKLLTKTEFTTVNFSYTANGFSGLFNNGNEVLSNTKIIIILLVCVVAIKILLDLFFSTKLGFMLTATGNNESVVNSLGKDCGFYKILGLGIANGLMGLSGALYAQLTRNYDNTCGSGKVVLALASVIIGLSLFSKIRFVKPTTAVIIGGIIYSLALNYFTIIDSDGTYLKIMNAACFAIILIVNNGLKKNRVKKAAKTVKKGGEPL
ncbi:MAG: ABC transporter permease [Clostridia bacterium]|nr:ABC transporter permease [Clostridia bacterium]